MSSSPDSPFTPSVAPAPAPGLMVNENVRLVRQIGEGGMGSVWLAEHLALESEVAVKFMSQALASHPAAVERFMREAKSSARIHHPNVVATLDSGRCPTAGNLPYIVMELLEGEDLETRIRARGRLTLDEVAQVVLQTSRALEKAHELGVVHRDIKPENIFLCGAGEELYVKVLDFGIAKIASTEPGDVRVTNTGATLGTPTYMSPEQMLSAKSVDFRCDLWALAVVAYQAVTGKLPFAGETYGAICLAVNRGKFRLPSRLRKSVPATVDEWFVRALARDPKKRFGSAKELGDAFVLAVETGSASRSGPRRAITPYSVGRLTTGSLGGASVTNDNDDEARDEADERGGAPARRKARRAAAGTRWVPLVAALALAAGALLAVFFGRPWWAHVAAPALAIDPPAATAPATAGATGVTGLTGFTGVTGAAAAGAPARDVALSEPAAPVSPSRARPGLVAHAALVTMTATPDVTAKDPSAAQGEAASARATVRAAAHPHRAHPVATSAATKRERDRGDDAADGAKGDGADEPAPAPALPPEQILPPGDPSARTAPSES